MIESKGLSRIFQMLLALTLLGSLCSSAGAAEINLSMANCQIGLSAAVFEVLIPLPECATSLSYSFI